MTRALKLSDLPATIREQATRQVSRQLGRGNVTIPQPSPCPANESSAASNARASVGTVAAPMRSLPSSARSSMRVNSNPTTANSATTGTSGTAKGPAIPSATDGAGCAVSTWYRTAAKGSQIVPVRVVRVTPMRLTLEDEQGCTSEVLRESPTETYWPDRAQAAEHVYERLRQDVLRTHEAVEAFEVREAELRRSNNPAVAS